MIYMLDLFGVFVFAVSGALAAGRKRMDLFGVVVIAVVTALGGGTLRDLVLGAQPVFWITDHKYILVAAAAALLTFVLARRRKPPYKLLLIADAFGLAIFTIIGTEKALSLGTTRIIAILMGMMTGVVGGMVRDILSGEIPLVLRREIYATASLCGAATFVGLGLVCHNRDICIFAAVVMTLALRLAAIKWDLSLPTFTSREDTNGKR